MAEATHVVIAAVFQQFGFDVWMAHTPRRFHGGVCPRREAGLRPKVVGEKRATLPLGMFAHAHTVWSANAPARFMGAARRGSRSGPKNALRRLGELGDRCRRGPMCTSRPAAPRN